MILHAETVNAYLGTGCAMALMTAEMGAMKPLIVGLDAVSVSIQPRLLCCLFKAMFTRVQFQTDPARKSTGKAFCLHETVLEPVRNGFKTEPHPILDPLASVPYRFQNASVLTEADPVRFGTVPVRSRVNITQV